MDVDLRTTEISVESIDYYLESKANKPETSYVENFEPEISPRTQHTKQILSHSLHFNQSYSNLQAVSKLVNSTPGARIQLPDTLYRIKKLVPPVIETQYYIQCSDCKDYSMTTTTEVECTTCSKVLKRAKSEYFVYLPLKPQIMKTINQHFNDIVSYSQSCSTDDIICDFQDGIVYKKIKAKYPDKIMLPLVVNTDGAAIFKSTNNSVWPILIISNFLRPSIRYIPENVMVLGIHEGI